MVCGPALLVVIVTSHYGMISDKLSEVGGGRSWLDFVYYTGICLEVLRRSTQDHGFTDRNLNPESVEYGGIFANQ